MSVCVCAGEDLDEWVFSILLREGEGASQVWIERLSNAHIHTGPHLHHTMSTPT